MAIPQTARFQKVLALAELEARRQRHAYIDTSDLLIGMLEDSNGIGATVLRSLGVSLADVRRQLPKVLATAEAELAAAIAAQNAPQPPTA